jgi:opacity protein-like surface antigen
VREVCFAYAIAPGLGSHRPLNGKRHGSSPVLSADLPPAPLPPAYQQAALPSQNVFEGWYLGGTIGGATVNYDLAPASGSVDTSGVLGGVIGGWSWQSGPIVLGIEGDFLGADVSGSRHFNAGFNQVSPNIDMMADLRLRAGYAITPRVLLFGAFGGACRHRHRRGVRRCGLLRLERGRGRRGRA